MIYNLQKHQFILTQDDVRDHLGVELVSFLGDDQQVPIFLAEASDDLYNWFYSKVPPSNLNIVEYVLATDERAQEAIFAALIAQTRRMIRSGSHLLKDKIGANYSFEELVSDIAKTELFKLQLHFFRGFFVTIPEGVVRGVDY